MNIWIKLIKLSTWQGDSPALPGEDEGEGTEEKEGSGVLHIPVDMNVYEVAQAHEHLVTKSRLPSCEEVGSRTLGIFN